MKPKYVIVDSVLHTETALIDLREVVYFEGTAVHLRNGEALVVSEDLAEALRAYCQYFLQALENEEAEHA